MRIMHNYLIFELGWLFPFSLPNDCNYNVLIKMTGESFCRRKNFILRLSRFLEYCDAQ